MPKLSRLDVDRADLLGIRVMFAGQGVTHDWRSPGAPALFCGWYWSKGNRREGGFKTRGGALRHALDTFAPELPADLDAARSKMHRTRRVRKWWQRHRDRRRLLVA